MGDKQPCKGHRTLEDLLDAAASAPTFGLNAKELILQAARQISKDDTETAEAQPKLASKAERTKVLAQYAQEKGPLCFGALPKEQRPLIAFSAVQRGKVPRINRQAILDRLTGQHLALAFNKKGIAPKADLIQQQTSLCKLAITSAQKQEEELFQKGKTSKAVYLNFAARSNASTWMQLNTPDLSTEGTRPSSSEAVPYQEARLHQDNARDLAENSPEIKAGDIHPPVSSDDVKLDSSLADIGKGDSQTVGSLERRLLEATGLESPGRQSPSEDSLSPNKGLPDSEASTSIGQLQHSRIGESMEEDKRKRSVENQQDHPGAQDARGELANVPSDGRGRSLAKGLNSKQSSESFDQIHDNASHVEDQPYKRKKVSHLSNAENKVSQEKVPYNPKVSQAVTIFLKKHLDPLYQAEVIDKDTYKNAIQKTVAKVMEAHLQDQDASFLITEGSQVRKLVLKYVQHMSKTQKIKES